MNLKYQVTIGTTARECRMGPNNTVLLKVGMQGRVILGPEGGSPGTVDVPLRFAVVREDDRHQGDHDQARPRHGDDPAQRQQRAVHAMSTEGLEFPDAAGRRDRLLPDLYRVRSGRRAEPERKKPAPKSRPKTATQSRPTG